MEIKEVSSSIFDNIINNVVIQLQEKLKNKLMGVLIIGSSSSKKIITNWSDIDLLIIIDILSENSIEIINSIISNQNIKIGCTIYSEKEILNGIMDAKSYYYLYLVQNNILNFKYIDNNLKIPIIKKEVLELKMKNILFNNIHICKRNLFYTTWDLSICKNQFKIIYASMKCILVLNGYNVLNYNETFTNFFKLYNFDKLDYLKIINDIIKNNVDVLFLKKYSLYFLKFLSENSDILKINEVMK